VFAVRRVNVDERVRLGDVEPQVGPAACVAEVLLAVQTPLARFRPLLAYLTTILGMFFLYKNTLLNILSLADPGDTPP